MKEHDQDLSSLSRLGQGCLLHTHSSLALRSLPGRGWMKLPLWRVKAEVLGYRTCRHWVGSGCLKACLNSPAEKRQELSLPSVDLFPKDLWKQSPEMKPRSWQALSSHWVSQADCKPERTDGFDPRVTRSGVLFKGPKESNLFYFFQKMFKERNVTRWWLWISKPWRRTVNTFPGRLWRKCLKVGRGRAKRG